jgi:DNA-binding XRE family transcriptional regulator
MHRNDATIDRICEECGAAFRCAPWMLRRGHGRFCSRPCFGVSDGRRRRAASVDRFWANVAKDDGCWLWAGYVQPDGYGQASYKGRRIRAHRLSWELTHGPIPNDIKVLHTCDNPTCVRPDHLFLGTNADNSRDMVRKGRQASGDRSPSRRHREPRPRGERHHNSRYTDEQVAEMRALYAEGGWTQRQLAARFGVSQAAIQQVLSGKARKKDA